MIIIPHTPWFRISLKDRLQPEMPSRLTGVLVLVSIIILTYYTRNYNLQFDIRNSNTQEEIPTHDGPCAQVGTSYCYECVRLAPP